MEYPITQSLGIAICYNDKRPYCLWSDIRHCLIQNQVINRTSWGMVKFSKLFGWRPSCPGGAYADDVEEILRQMISQNAITKQ